MLIDNDYAAFFCAPLDENRLWIRKKVVPLQPGKSYTTSSPGTPPGLDRSNGTGL